MADCRRSAVWQSLECCRYAAMQNPAIRVISGLSLPLALELVDNQSSMNVDELCEHLTTIAQQTCVVWQHLETTEEDF